MLIAMIVAAPSAQAQQKSSGIKLTITAGIDGRISPGRPFPVSVIVESSRAVRGDLELSTLSFNGVRSYKVIGAEVPAGGRKQFDVMMSTPIDQEFGTAFRSNGKIVESQETAVSWAENEVIVGVLGPQPLPSLRTFRSEVTGSGIRSGVFPVRWLQLGPDALETLDYLVVDAEVGKAAPESAIATLFDWVASGGRLIVGSADPSDNSWLPGFARRGWARTDAGWSPDAAPPAFASAADAFSMPIGFGEATFVGRTPAELGSDRAWWETTVYPRVSRIPFGEMGPSSDFEVANILSRLKAGALRLGWFLIFLIGYMALVGPINYLVLRRVGRKELAWLTIPVLAVVFSIGAYVLARQSRSGLSVQQAATVISTKEGQFGKQVVTVTEAAAGKMRLGFPSNSVEVVGFEFGGRGRERRVVRVTSGGAEALIDAAPFSVHAAKASVDSFDGTLDTVITWNGESLNAKVTNATPHRLTGVRVIAGGINAEVGELAPNGSSTVSLTVQQMRNAFRGGFMFDPDQDVEGQLTNALFNIFQSETALRDGVRPYAFGYADASVSAPTLDGKRQKPEGKILVATPADIEVLPSISGGVPSSLGTLEYLSGQRQQGRPPIGFPTEPGIVFEGVGDSLFRYRIPSGVDLQRIVSAKLLVHAFVDGGGAIRGPMPEQQAQPQQVGPPKIEVYDWQSRSWVDLQAPPDLHDAAIPIPLSAISPSGATFMRIGSQQQQFMRIMHVGIEPELR